MSGVDTDDVKQLNSHNKRTKGSCSSAVAHGKGLDGTATTMVGGPAARLAQSSLDF